MLECVFILFETTLFYWMTNHLLNCKFTGKKKMAILVSAVLAESFLVEFISLQTLTVRVLLFATISLVIIHILFKEHFLIKLFLVLLSYYIFLISDIIAGNLMSLVCNVHIESVVSGTSCFPIMFLIISKTITLFLFLSYVRFSKKISFYIPVKYWVSMNLIIGSFMVIINFFMSINGTLQDESSYYSMQILGISTYFLILSILTIYFFGEICLFYQKEQQRYALELNNKALEQQVVFQEASVSYLRKIRHDIQSNLINIAFLMKENHIEESIKYINAITSTLEMTKSITCCGNKYLDAILNFTTALCKKNHIDMRFTIDEAPEVSVAPIDLSAVFSNVLNNAIDANLTLNEADRYISLKMFCYKNYLSVIVKNPYNHTINEKDGLLITNKKDKSFHGYGVKSIRSSVDRYGGIFKYSYKDNVFTVMIMLPITLNSD